MSRDFPNDKGNERIEVGTWAIPGSSTAIVMGARVRFDTLGSDARFFSKGTSGVASNHWYMIGKRNSNDRCRVRLKLNGSTVTWEASGAQLLDTTGLWYHCIFQWWSAGPTRAFYVLEQGGTITSDIAGATTGVVTSGGTEACWLGNQPGTTNTGMDGQLADVFVDAPSTPWSADKMQAWVHGAPTAALLDNPAGYWPLFGTADPEPDLSGNVRNGTLAGTGSIIAGANPGAIAVPFGRTLFFVPVSAAGGATKTFATVVSSLSTVATGLSLDRSFSVASSSPSAATASITRSVPFTVASASPSAVTAVLGRLKTFTVVSTGPSILAVALTVRRTRTFATVVESPSAVATTLSRTRGLITLADSPSAVLGALAVQRPLITLVESPSAVAPVLSLARSFITASTSESAIAAALTIPGTPKTFATLVSSESQFGPNGDIPVTRTRGYVAQATGPSAVATSLTRTRGFVAASTGPTAVAAVLTLQRSFAVVAESPSAVAEALSLTRTFSAASTSPSVIAAALTVAGAGTQKTFAVAALSPSAVAATLTTTRFYTDRDPGANPNYGDRAPAVNTIYQDRVA